MDADLSKPAIAQLGFWHLVACGALLAVVVAASKTLELGLESRLVVSALRCAGQLMLLISGKTLVPLWLAICTKRFVAEPSSNLNRLA